MDTKYLSISSEQFVACYYDIDFAYEIELKGPKDKPEKQLEYLKWGAAKHLLTKHFPTLHVEFEQNSEGLPAFRTPNNLLKNDAQEAFFERIVNIKASLEQDRVTYEKTDKRDQWKVQKEIDKKEKEIINLQNQLFYDNSGYYLKPYLVDSETGLRTPYLFFPLMDYNNDPIYQADSRDISDNIQRALVKCIAYYTGIGLLVYTRGAGIGKDKVCDSEKFKKIDEIVRKSARLGRQVDKSIVNFGTSTMMLDKVIKDLDKEIAEKTAARQAKVQ
jgi:Protein of unknown function (DUF1071).